MTKSFILTITALVVGGAFAHAQTNAPTAPTDPQIAMIAVTADNIDIDAGKLAAEKAYNPKVKEFAPAYGAGSYFGQQQGDGTC